MAVNEDRLYKGCCKLNGIVQINNESIMPCKHETMRVTHNPYYLFFVQSTARVWFAAGFTEMRSGFNGLAANILDTRLV